MELAAHAGWDPAGLSAALQTLARVDQLLGHDPKRTSFFSTHPAIAERVVDTGRAAGAISRGSGAPIAPTRAAFFARLDGLVVGRDPANGVFVDRRFLDPDFGFVWDVPAGWKSGNTPDAGVAAEPEGRAMLLLRMVGEGRDPVAGARADGLQYQVNIPAIFSSCLTGRLGSGALGSPHCGTPAPVRSSSPRPYCELFSLLAKRIL